MTEPSANAPTKFTRTHYNMDIKRQAMELYATGMTYVAVAGKLQIHPSTVLNWTRRGIEPKPRRRRSIVEIQSNPFIKQEPADPTIVFEDEQKKKQAWRYKHDSFLLHQLIEGKITLDHIKETLKYIK